MRYLITLALLLSSALAGASTITYQGQLQDGSGQGVFSGQTLDAVLRKNK